MSGNNEKRELRPEDYPEHECLWHFIDSENDDYDTIECIICSRRMNVSTDPDKRETHYQMYTSLGSPSFGMS